MNKKKQGLPKNNRDPTEKRNRDRIFSVAGIAWKTGIRGYVMYFIKVGVLSYLFYRNLFSTIILASIAGLCGIFLVRRQDHQRWQKQINLEFREGMQGIASALNAGYSVENAFVEATKDLELLYGKRSVLAPEFQMVVTKCQLNCPVEETLRELALRTEVEDIRRFAEIFQTAKRTGGDLIAITRTTADRISEKIEVRREIETMYAGKRMEAQVMNCVPLGMILYFWLCSPDFLSCLYQGNGRLIMTFFLLVYLLAYCWSEKIIQIKL